MRRKLRLESLEDRTLLTGQLVIAEVNYNPYEILPGEIASDNEDFEFIEFHNAGTSPVDLSGVHISSAIDFSFSGSGVTSLGPDAFVLVVKNLTAFESRYGSGLPIAGQFASGNLNNAGEKLVVMDGATTLFDISYMPSGDWPIRADGRGATLQLQDPDDDPSSGTSWRGSTEFLGSPGRAGIAAANSIVVNEVLTHTDPPAFDSIELLNIGSAAVNLGGWYLSDNYEEFKKFQIPANTILQPGEYLVFDEHDFNPSFGMNPAPNHFAFSSAHGDEVWLMKAVGGSITEFVDSVVFGAAANSESLGRWPNATGEIYPMTSTTLGAANSGPRVGPIIISELNYNPPDPGNGVLPEDLEYIEIFNPTSQAVVLTEWHIQGGVDFDFAAGTSLPSHETLLILPFDPDDPANSMLKAGFLNHFGLTAEPFMVGGYSRKLNNAGETVQLLRADEPPLEEPSFFPQLLEDEVKYNDKSPWPESPDGTGNTLQRENSGAWGNDPDSWDGEQPTPGTTSRARHDSFAFEEDSSPQLLDVLDDDSLIPQTLTIMSTTSPVGGSLTVVPAATGNPPRAAIRYSPHTNFAGADSFTYTIMDHHGKSFSADVSLDVIPVNDPPQAEPDTISVNEDSMDRSIDVLQNDVTVDAGETLEIVVVSMPSHGVATLDGGGNDDPADDVIRYTPMKDYHGPDSFTYMISDGNGLADSATVTVTVISQNDPPVARNDSYTVDEDSAGNQFAVLANDDAGPDNGETLAIKSIGDPAHGTATVHDNGTPQTTADDLIVYTPDAGYFGGDNFSYTISDANGGTASAQVSVTIVPVGPTSWQNVNLPEDVSGDGTVFPIDALLVINTLNDEGPRVLPDPSTAPDPPPPFFDVNGDGMVLPIDALLVINYLNDPPAAEGPLAPRAVDFFFAEAESLFAAGARKKGGEVASQVEGMRPT